MGSRLERPRSREDDRARRDYTLISYLLFSFQQATRRRRLGQDPRHRPRDPAKTLPVWSVGLVKRDIDEVNARRRRVEDAREVEGYVLGVADDDVTDSDVINRRRIPFCSTRSEVSLVSRSLAIITEGSESQTYPTCTRGWKIRRKHPLSRTPLYNPRPQCCCTGCS